MQKIEKKRAPRNRTLTLTKDDYNQLSSRLLLAENIQSPHNLKNTTIKGDINNVLPYLPTNKIDLLIIDPPYNLTKIYNGKKFNSMKTEDYEVWFESWFLPLLDCLKPTASVYVCCDWKTSITVFNVLNRHLFIRNRITWEREKGRGAKTNWKNCSEDIWFATVSDNYTFNVDAVKLKKRIIAPYKKDGVPKGWSDSSDGKFRLTFPSNLWTDISIPFWSMPENTDHPTQKPEKLVAKLILSNSNEGDLVLDPFLGSGTTSVVAKKLGRNYIGIEQELEYCLLAEKRLVRAEKDKTIQGYDGQQFWERNSGPDQKLNMKINRSKDVL